MTTPNTVLDDPPLALPAAVLDLNLSEVKVLRRALKRLKYEVDWDLRRNIASGWQPEPGKKNINLITLQVIQSLLTRLPLPERQS